MTGRSHAVIGIATAAIAHSHIARLALNPVEAIIVIIAAALGGLLPDIDSGMSAIRTLTGTGRTWWGGRIIDWFVTRLLPHRGLTHTLMVWAMVTSLTIWLFGSAMPGAVFAFSLAYLSHLIADALTPEGVPLLAPAWDKRIGLPRFLAITTGSWAETIAVAALLVWAGAMWR